ncbi:MAG: 30S ribosomal protein S16 [Anaerolineae bacterium]|jgi:small subunit ribosomal protein S16|nr:30S ribosomal protein S16 [Anaerolineae bacterium]MBT7190701.1 30S ribosomal protein S16 [Anaerolineae bacterium]MBT7988289.1 30S ribosomal protein S16 [Anaerolineae bacterium]
MVRIRLRRTGMKGQASYRIVAAEKEKPRDGKFLEILGTYNPRTEPSTVEVKEDRIYEWLKNGAQPSDSVKQIFGYTGVLDRYERFKAGEEVEVLMAESAKMMEERNVNPRTRRD